jgi:hypothetical protein
MKKPKQAQAQIASWSNPSYAPPTYRALRFLQAATNGFPHQNKLFSG